MPINKKQLVRLIKFVAELKQNAYPNSKSFAKILRKTDIQENLNISCNPRTIQRDINVLIQDFRAPIKFDHDLNGYYLTNHYWEFQCPLFCDNMILTSILAVRLAEDIVPQPLKSMMREAIDTQLTTNNSEFLDEAFINSLIVASATKAVVQPDIFKIVFDGWRNRNAIEINYRKTDGSIQQRLFEPHIIAFHKGIWYTKGFIRPENEERVYAMQRIVSAALSTGCFEIDKNLLKAVEKNGLFNYPKLKNVKLLCDHAIAFYLYEHQEAKHLKIETLDNGDLIVTMPPAVEHDLIRWILGEAGRIKVLEPDFLRKKILQAGQNIIKSCKS